MKTYSEHNLSEAKSEVESGNLTCYGASKKYQVPKVTTRSRLIQCGSSKHG